MGKICGTYKARGEQYILIGNFTASGNLKESARKPKYKSFS